MSVYTPPKERIEIEIDAASQAALEKIVANMPGVAKREHGDSLTEQYFFPPDNCPVRGHVVVYKEFQERAVAYVKENNAHCNIRPVYHVAPNARTIGKRHRVAVWAANPEKIVESMPGIAPAFENDVLEHKLAILPAWMVKPYTFVETCVLERHLSEALAHARNAGAEAVYSAPIF